jgi:hypothetical protein
MSNEIHSTENGFEVKESNGNVVITFDGGELLKRLAASVDLKEILASRIKQYFVTE